MMKDDELDIKRLYTDKLGEALEDKEPDQKLEELSEDVLGDIMKSLEKQAVKERNPRAAEVYLKVKQYIDNRNLGQNRELSADEIAGYAFRAIRELAARGYTIPNVQAEPSIFSDNVRVGEGRTSGVDTLPGMASSDRPAEHVSEPQGSDNPQSTPTGN